MSTQFSLIAAKIIESSHLFHPVIYRPSLFEEIKMIFRFPLKNNTSLIVKDWTRNLIWSLNYGMFMKIDIIFMNKISSFHPLNIFISYYYIIIIDRIF